MIAWYHGCMETEDKRVPIQFEHSVYESIRRLAFESRTSFAQVVRLCVEAAFEQVKKDLQRNDVKRVK
jgi:hypothetical protein